MNEGCDERGFGMNEDGMNEHWIFLRGLTRGQGHWGDFPTAFRKKFPGVQIEFLDLPGCGTRVDEVSPLTMKANLEAVRKHSQFIKDGKKVSLLSISLGSMIAVLWQEHHPSEVKEAVLINTSFRGLPPWKRIKLLNLPKIFSVPFKKTSLEKEEIISKIICHNEENRLRNLPLLAEFSDQHPFQFQNFFRQIVAASLAQFPSEARRPILILSSRKDRLVSSECSIQLGKMWKLPVDVHPHAGHDLPIDDPDWLLRRLANFSSHRN